MKRQDEIWFPTALTASGIEWTQTSAERLSGASFLFGNALSGGQKTVRPPLDSSWPPVRGTSQRPSRYIFHTAFCCSTLLARALDLPGKVLALKEPDILMQLANLERTQPGRAGEIVPSVHKGLFCQGSEAIVVKPTNAANRITTDLMMQPDARAIIIHSDLESFLLSIARKGEEGRSFGRRLYNIFSMDNTFAQSLPTREVFTLSDLQIAGFVWALQCAQLQDAVSKAPEKYRLIHCDAFLAAPDQTIRAANGYFDLGLSDTDIMHQAQSDLFARDSKFPDQAYDVTIRKDERHQAETQFADAISFVREWVGKLPLPTSIKGTGLI